MREQGCRELASGSKSIGTMLILRSSRPASLILGFVIGKLIGYKKKLEKHTGIGSVVYGNDYPVLPQKRGLMEHFVAPPSKRSLSYAPSSYFSRKRLD